MAKRTKGPVFSAFDPLLDGRPDRTFDLHGQTADQARAALVSFVASTPRGALLHVITGKGRGSSGGPVLRRLVAGMLKGDLKVRVRDWSLDDGEGGFRIRLR